MVGKQAAIHQVPDLWCPVSGNPMNVLTELKARFRAALAGLSDDPESLLEMIRPSQDPKFGDYQANFAMPLGKRLKKSPREIAQEVVAQLDLADICRPPEVAGPGFINLKLDDDWIAEQLLTVSNDERLGVPAAEPSRTYVIDFSSPNVAKPMHVGHIRSTVIGDALCRMLRYLGHRVTSDNHLGDWGTQFGMIIYGYKHFLDQRAYQEQPVAELSRLYQLVRRLIDFREGLARLPELTDQVAEMASRVNDARNDASPADKKAAKAARRLQSQLSQTQSELRQLRQSLDTVRSNTEFSALAEQHADIEKAVLNETARLHASDHENVGLWKLFLPDCRQEIQKIYDRLNVSFDVEHGESFYHDRLADVVQRFEEAGLSRRSDGATCVFLDEFDAPMIIRKRDGAFLYATTDLATIEFRRKNWNPDVILYVVDFRQGEHFDKLFVAARLIDDRDIELVHVSFGTVLGEDGRPFKTRSGDTVGLEGLLDEAVSRALRIVSENDDQKKTELSNQQRRTVAEVVGIGALKYADLSQNRTSDYVFSYEKMLAMNGNTATYMQYSYARVHGIIARGQVDLEAIRKSSSAISLGHPAERALGLKLLQFAEAIEASVADYRPNLLTSYLFDLAQCYSAFFENCPVLKADSDDQRHSRLLLCDLTARTIRQGLALLGIGVVDKM